MDYIKVSVILPSFNVAAYIKECIESVINQTLKDIEIICVDAGSTDGTLEILREYEAADERIRLLLSDKKSYGYQMNMGMDYARGRYIGIVETDDFIKSEMYEKLYKVTKEHDVDIVKADFYRVMKKDNEKLNSMYQKLSEQDEDYNRVIDLHKEKHAFNFLMNTWAGIYRTEFIKRNNIRHNESLGASFQDNGFWFQTLVRSRNLYLVKVPFYMNRRDNPNSSVFDKGKVLCICEEYAFIKEYLLKENLFEEYIDEYYKACFRNYQHTLHKLEGENQHLFIKRFHDEFADASKNGELEKCSFCREDINIIEEIVADAEDYLKKINDDKQRIINRLSGFKKIIIYGAGSIGNQFYKMMEKNQMSQKIICFAVTKLSENYTHIEDKKVCEIYSLTQYTEDAVVVIAVDRKFKDTLRNNAERAGFHNIVDYDDTCGE